MCAFCPVHTVLCSFTAVKVSSGYSIVLHSTLLNNLTLSSLLYFIVGIQKSCYPGFHMSGKSQTIGDFNFCRPSQIYRIIATSQTQILPINLAGNGKCAKNWNLRDRGTEAQQFRGLVMSEIHRRRPQRYEFEFSFVGNDRRPSQNLGRVGKIGTLPILQICPHPSQTIGISTISSFH